MRLPKTARRAVTMFLAATGLGKPRATHLPAGAPQALDELSRKADSFPSMGGVELGPFLRRLGRDADPDAAIVEVGVWLGAGTAQIAYGLAERRLSGEPTPAIHAYDRFWASRSEVAKAAAAGVELDKGGDTAPWVAEALRPFGAEVFLHKGDLDLLSWSAGPIGVFILDAAKGPRQFRNMMRIFGPFWRPGRTTVVLMDYAYYKFGGKAEFECQARFVEAHPDAFEPIDLGIEDPGTMAAFRYTAEVDFEQAIRDGLL